MTVTGACSGGKDVYAAFIPAAFISSRYFTGRRRIIPPVAPPAARRCEAAMLDVMMIALGALSCALLIGYVALCEKL
jgi:hypothetical protein